MNRTELFQAGRKAISQMLADSSTKDVAKSLLTNAPAKAAGAAVLTRVLGFGFMPLAASFAVGAVVGAGALILLAPGGEAMRAAVGEEIEKWSARRRSAKDINAKDTGATAETKGGDDAVDGEVVDGEVSKTTASKNEGKHGGTGKHGAARGTA